MTTTPSSDSPSNPVEPFTRLIATRHDDGTKASYDAAVRLVLRQQSASIALVQCHLRIGYGAACALFERMQVDGIVTSLVAAGPVWVLNQAYRDARGTIPADAA